MAQQANYNLSDETALTKLLKLTGPEKSARGLAFTPAEIVRQPQTWRQASEIVNSQRPRLKEFLTPRPTQVIFSGAGTSDYIGEILAASWRRAGFNAWAVPSTTLLTEADAYLSPAQSSLLVSFSRSGDSPESVAVVENAPQMRHLIITCNAAGRLAQLAQRPNAYGLILDEDTNDQGLAMTSSFSNMLLAGLLWGDEEITAADIARLCAAGGKMLSRAGELASHLAAQNFQRAFFLGAGQFYGLARESALKVMELTAGRILALSETPLGLRHGPLSALDAQTLVVLFLSGDATRQRFEINLLQEIKATNPASATLVITPAAVAPSLPAQFVLNYEAADLRDSLRPVAEVIFAQIFALFASLRYGLKPDAPSPNGAINRVVTHI